jgi:hypothetical protein
MSTDSSTDTSIATLRAAIFRVDYGNRKILDPLAALLEISWDDFARQHRPAMTLPQLDHWIAAGMGIGAHSMDHPIYAALSLEEQLAQTLDSMDWVTANLPVSYRAFAFPHFDTGVSQAFFDLLFSAPRPPQLVLGNSTGMKEKRPGVFHRYIDEQPARSSAKMAKAVLGYSIFRSLIGDPYVHRG